MNDLQKFKDKLNIKETIDKLNNLPQADCPVNHYFADGQYVRETKMPAGS